MIYFSLRVNLIAIQYVVRARMSFSCHLYTVLLISYTLNHGISGIRAKRATPKPTRILLRVRDYIPILECDWDWVDVYMFLLSCLLPIGKFTPT